MSEQPRNEHLSLLAFDYGEKRIGLASASTVAGTSSGLGTLLAQDGEPDWRDVDQLVAEWSPDILIVGLPYNMDGTESAMTDRVLKFVDALVQRYGLPIETIDERLTSVEAEGLLKEQRRQGVKSKRLKKGDIDSLAAQLIAENWMNVHRSES